jgi:hypothetical protein
MANRIFVIAVFMLWLGSMSWLLLEKILPSYYDGEAPIAAGFEPNVYVAWKVSWSGREVGHAASIRLQGVSNTTNLQNRVVLEDVPLLDLVPTLMRQVVGDIGRMKLDAKTLLEFDSLDNFSRFSSRVSINDISPVLDLRGEVNGPYLELEVDFNGVTYSPHVPLPDQAVLGESLFPDAKLPYMYVGRRWHEEVYSPFRSPSAPVETVEAEVTGMERIEFGGEQVRVMRVEYRGTASPGVPEESRLQAIAWVRAEDGLVLRHDVHIASSKLRFERLPDEEADKIGRELLAQPERRRGRGGRRGGWSRRQGRPYMDEATDNSPRDPVAEQQPVPAASDL